MSTGKGKTRGEGKTWAKVFGMALELRSVTLN